MRLLLICLVTSVLSIEKWRTIIITMRISWLAKYKFHFRITKALRNEACDAWKEMKEGKDEVAKVKIFGYNILCL